MPPASRGGRAQQAFEALKDDENVFERNGEGHPEAEDGRAEGEDAAESGQEELYALLNVERTASVEEIKDKYRILAALLHPDRHHDPELREAANSRFQAVNQAYEVLSDPQKRAIYDTLGEEGLKAKWNKNWDVGSKYKSPEELRAEYEKLARKKMETELDSLVKSKGELIATFDARVFFLSSTARTSLGGPSQLSFTKRLQTITTQQLFFKHSFNVPMNEKTSLEVSTQMLTRRGVGGGNLVLRLKHQATSKLGFEVGLPVLHPRILTVKTTYAPDDDSFITAQMPVRTTHAPPPFQLTFGRRISENITNTFTVTSGTWSLGSWGRISGNPPSTSTFSTGFISSNGWNVDLTSTVSGQQASFGWRTTVLNGVKVRVGTTATSQGGLSVYASGDKRLSENTSGGMTLDLALNGTMTLKLRVARLGQKLQVPIIVASEFNAVLASVLLVAPSATAFVLERYYLQPRRRSRASNRLSTLRKENADALSTKKQEAEEAVALLGEAATKRAEAEARKNGLVIEEASYGSFDLELGPTDVEKGVRWIDVRIPLQALVQNSQLVIPEGRSKSHLLGFFDITMGERKHLRVVYTFKGRKHSCIVRDREAFAAPVRAHLME